MTKNKAPKPTSNLAFDGRQVRIQDGLEMVTNGVQTISEGIQIASRAQQGRQVTGYSNQTSSQTTPQRTFTPARGPKIPPMKK